MKFQNPLALSALIGLATAEVPQEHSHEKYLRAVNALLKQDNPLNIQDAVFGLLGNAAAEAGAGDVTNLDCLHQSTADSAFSAAKAAGDVDGMASALVFRAVERNTGSVGLKSVLCDETAQNPEIAALSQHQDPASDGAAEENKKITLELARQLSAVGADPMLALDAGTFEPGDPNDNTGAGNTCDDADDAEGCIFTQNLLVQDATPEEIQAAVSGAGGNAGGNAGAEGAANSTAIAKRNLRRATKWSLLNRRGKGKAAAADEAGSAANATSVSEKLRRGNKNANAEEDGAAANATSVADKVRRGKKNANAEDDGAAANATSVADKFRRGNKNANANAGAAANETADAVQSAGNGGNANANGNGNNQNGNQNNNGNQNGNDDAADDATGNGNTNNNGNNGNNGNNQNNNGNNADDAADDTADDATGNGNANNNGNNNADDAADDTADAVDDNTGNNQNGNNQNGNNNNQNNNGNQNNGNADNANDNAGNDAATGTDVQTFTGDLGGPPPPVTSDAASDKPFSTNGATFVNAGAALQRSCAVQHNACADAANSGSEDITVADCDAQEDDCLAAASLKKLRRSSSVGSKGRRMRITSNLVSRQNLDFGECQDPSIQFAEGLDGRKEASFGPAGDFEHGSAQNINIISSFICGQLGSRCQAADDAVAACEQGQADAQGLQGQEAADAFNTALGL